MKLEKFTKLIEGIERRREQVGKAYDIGLDLLSFDDDYFSDVLGPLMEEVFGKEGVDWINWYVYERESLDGKTILKAWDKNKNEICFDIPSLYDTVKECIRRNTNL